MDRELREEYYEMPIDRLASQVEFLYKTAGDLLRMGSPQHLKALKRAQMAGDVLTERRRFGSEMKELPFDEMYGNKRKSKCRRSKVGRRFSMRNKKNGRFCKKSTRKYSGQRDRMATPTYQQQMNTIAAMKVGSSGPSIPKQSAKRFMNAAR